MNKNVKKLLSILLSVIMIVAVMPVVFAGQPSIHRWTRQQNGGDGFYIYAYVTGNGTGVTDVKFPTCTSDVGWNWLPGSSGNWTIGGQTYNWVAYAQRGSYNNEDGPYTTHIYAYSNGEQSAVNAGEFTMNMKPGIGAYTKVQNGDEGFYVYTYVDNHGVGSITRFTCPTCCPSVDWIWYDGETGSWTINGVTYNCRAYVNATRLSSIDGPFTTHIYVYNSYGYSSAIDSGTFTFNRTHPAILRSKYVQNQNNGHYIYAYASAQNNGTVTNVKFPTCTNDVGWIWQPGTEGNWIIDGQTYNWRGYAPKSSYNNSDGPYTTHIYAYSSVGYEGAINAGTFTYNHNKPLISRVAKVQEGKGFWVYAYADANGGATIDRVQFPSWTLQNDQDDLPSSWETNPACTGTAGSWTVNGQTYNYRFFVDPVAHGNQYTAYQTHVYAFNKAGYQGPGVDTGRFDLVFDLQVNPNGGMWNGVANAQSVSGSYGEVKTIADPTPAEGYTFTGWTQGGVGIWNAANKQFTLGNGTGTLTANYSLNSYTVTFVNGVTGETLKTETVNHGAAAAAPTPPSKIKIDNNADSHYTFTGWDTPYDNITGPTTVTAQYALTGHSYGEYTQSTDSHTRVCSDCGYVDAAAHSYSDAVTAPTCTAQGYTTHTCGACGYSYSDTYTDKAPHDFSVYVEEVTAATCEANATATYKCANCTETTVKAVPGSQLDHSYTGDVKKNDDGTHSFKCVNGCGAYGGTVGCDYDDVITEPTCTEGGYTTHTCKICSYSYTDAETPGNGHDFSVYVEEVNPATCLANAKATYKCANCDATTEKDVPDSQLDHSYTGDVRKNDDGTHSFKCVNGCGDYGGTAGCDYDDVITEPTCTEGGYTTHTCKICDYSYTDAETPENGHDFSVYVEEVTPATCLANATATYKCANCTETTVKAVPGSQLDHSYTGDVKKNGDGTHSFKCVNGCGEYGGTVGCDYDDVITEPTCTAGGYTTHTCKVCGYSYTDAETPESGHDFSVYVEEVTPATCEANATATYKCANCTETTVKAVPGSQLDHSYTGDVRKNGDGTHSFKCVNGCGEYGGTVGCDYDDVITDPTCTAGGYTTHTCKICGYSYTDAETPESGHDFTVYVKNVTAATCVENRVDRFKCVSCEETEDREVENSKDPANHVGEEKTENLNAVDATCVKEGSYDVVVTCLSCHQVKSTTHKEGVLDPENHSGETRTAEEDVIPGTCVSPRKWNEVTRCADCGAVLSSIAHTGTEDPANHAGPMEFRGKVEATEDENGFTGDKYCAACNTLVEAGQSVHRTKGACNYCGGYHEGVWGSVVTAVHGILWLLRQLLRIG